MRSVIPTPAQPPPFVGKGAPNLRALTERILREAREKAGGTHHRLPQFYLKQFAGRTGKIALYDPQTGNVERKPPAKALAEDGYYDVLDQEGAPMAVAEVLYEDLESRGSRVYRRMLDGESPTNLSRQQRSEFAFLMAAQVTRGDQFREFDQQLANTVSAEMLRAQAEHAEAWIADLNARAEGEGRPPVDFSADDVRRNFRDLNAGRYSVEHSAEMRLHLSVVAVRELAAVFFDFAWHVVRFDEPVLFTSEHPVTYWRAPSRADRLIGLGPMNSEEIRFPLSPNVALVATHPHSLPFRDRSGMGDRESAARINYATWASDPRRVLVTSPDVSGYPLPGFELMPSPSSRGGPAPVITR